MILGGILLFFIIVAIVLSTTETPEHLDVQNPITSQDGLEDVITDEKTVHVKTHDKEKIKEEVIKATTITVDDFVEKATTVEFKDTVGGKQLTEHISEVIQLHPDSKKHLTKRQRKTVDKIVKEKK